MRKDLAPHLPRQPALTAAPEVSLSSVSRRAFRLALLPSSHGPTLHTPGQKSEPGWPLALALGPFFALDSLKTQYP